jgi:hypothetical protein
MARLLAPRVRQQLPLMALRLFDSPVMVWLVQVGAVDVPSIMPSRTFIVDPESKLNLALLPYPEDRKNKRPCLAASCQGRVWGLCQLRLSPPAPGSPFPAGLRADKAPQDVVHEDEARMSWPTRQL